MVKDTIKNVLRHADIRISGLLLGLGIESDSLVILYFHGVFANKEELGKASGITMSYDGITLEGLRNIIKCFIASGYGFISPVDILAGLNDHKKHVMLTFDDGYASNALALQVLREFEIPALFFVSVGYVLQNRGFWWDVVYRELHRRAYPLDETRREIERLKQFKTEEINEYIASSFGPGAFDPVAELDRPFTTSELRDFSRDPHVFIGNHTMDHAILTNYKEDEIRSQILMAQDALHDITRSDLPVISYPSGEYSAEIIKLCKEMKFKLGFTIDAEKVPLPVAASTDSSLSLGRFSLRGNDSQALLNCNLARSDFLLTRSLKHIRRRLL
jgi:peptidoglycan/xylan/chitin deacetylase (PgdA/CDA1 family)